MNLRDTPRGAEFVRADLHIHSFGGSYDVSDNTMTPQSIVDTAFAMGLRVISVTDHNSISNVASTIAAARGTSLLVVPGVELSTPGGHLLAYLETCDQLTRLMSKLEFSVDGKSCRTSAFDVLRHVEDLGGLVIAAHIDRESGLEKAIPGYGDPKSSVVCSRTLAAIEISSLDALDWYSDQDSNVPRKAIWRKRIDGLDDPFVAVLPRIQSSDAHTLKALGRNYAQTERLTRLKMNALNWASFRAAFADPEARVRLEEGLPNATAGFVAMHLTGGFLNGQTIGFSPNLTCIIGGRGSGKSTAFAALRAVAGTNPAEDLLASEAWPDQIDVVYRDEFGAVSELRLTRDGVSCISNPGAAPPHIAFESLAQGEMARTIEKCGSDPEALLRFLDELVDLREHRELAESTRKSLAVNSESIRNLGKDLDQIEPTQNLLNSRLALQETAKKEKGAELIDLQNQLAASVALRKRLLLEFQQLVADIKGTLRPEVVNGLGQLAEDSRAIENPEKPSPIPALVDRLDAIIKTAVSSLDAEFKRGTTEINTFIAECGVTQQNLSEALTARVDALKAKGVPLDLKGLGLLAEEIRRYANRIATIKRQQEGWKQATAARTKLLQSYLDAQADVARERQRLAVRLNSKLSDTLLDLTIDLKFAEGRLSPEAEVVLKDVMEWRTAAVPRAPALVRSMGVPTIIKAINDNDAGVIAAAKNSEGQAIVSLVEAQAIVTRFRERSAVSRLEECRWSDLPSLIVRRPWRDANGQQLKESNGKLKFVTREFAQLSLGQKQAIILGMLLCSSSTSPLLIDQPEDNLDSEFVFQVLVRTLRRIKEHRQVILVTHNANIGVLADPDLVVPLKASADKGVVMSPGSVEQPETRTLVCKILEGGSAAYQKRGTLYGLG